MAKVKLTKKEKDKIHKSAKEYEHELLLEFLVDSKDDNIIALLNEILVTVKMIHGEEIMEYINMKIERDEQSLLHHKQMIDDKHRTINNMFTGQDYFSKYNQSSGMVDWAKDSNYGNDIWKDPNDNDWYNKSFMQDIYRQPRKLDSTGYIWNTSNTLADTSSKYNLDNDTTISITNLAVQIQAMNDLKMHHTHIKDYIDDTSFNKLTTNEQTKIGKKENG